MTTWVCKTCGTQYPPSEEPPGACAICEDPRQFVPHDEGQVWLRWDDFTRAHRADIREEHGFLGIGSAPDFAIAQRALVVKSSAGNVLWDCISLLNAEIVDTVSAAGGLAAIVVSHPHYYGSMVEWARTFGCPILIHEDDRAHVMRSDPLIRFWSGETYDLGGGVTAIRCGGHFAGAQVLHVAGQRALLSGDVVSVVPDRRFVSFMYSYPNLIPLAASKVQALAAALAPFAFDTIHGAWYGRVVERDGSEVVRRSADRYVRAVTEPGLPS